MDLEQRSSLFRIYASLISATALLEVWTCWEVGHVWQGTIDEWGYNIYKQTYHTIHCNLSMDVCLIDITECYLVNSKYLAQLYPECLQSSSIEQSWFFWFQWYIILHWLIRNWQRYTFKSILMTMPAELRLMSLRINRSYGELLARRLWRNSITVGKVFVTLPYNLCHLR